MKIYSTLITIGLLLTCVSCDKASDESSFVGNSNRSLIVDYTLGSAEAQTRAVGEDDRINSLHYLVYDADKDVLVKQREIPDIDKVTAWPLTRENMTWAQRQALQDTLLLNNRYRVMFVANANPALFGAGQTALLKNTEKFSTVHLGLPDAAFSDNNMYYFWAHEIAAATPSHDNYYLCNVLLQRIVTRTSVSRIDIPADPDGSHDTFIKQMIEQSLFTELTCRAADGLQEGSVRKEIKKQLDEFRVPMNAAASTGVIPILYAGNVGEINNVFPTDETADRIIASLREQIVSNLFAKLKAGTKLNDYLKSWDMGTNRKVEIEYSAGKRVNAFYLDRTKACNNAPDQPVLTCYADGGAFEIIGLAANYPADMQQNDIREIRLYGDDASTPQLVIDGVWNAGQEMNTWYDAVCNPVQTIRATNDNTEIISYEVDLKTVLSDIWNTNGFVDGFEQAMIDVVFKPQGGKYGADFSHFKFPVPLPKLDEANGAVSIQPGWTIDPL